MNKITLLGLSIIFLHSLFQICKFYGVEPESYKIYIYFLILIVLSILILPNDYPKL